MAQENIPLVITLGGVDKAVTSVREFAKAIKEAQNRLLLIGDEGSMSYQQLDKDIQKARVQLQEFREDANQTKVGRELKDFIEVGSSITSVFVGAQAALQAFGVESDSAGKASAVVQNLLTISIAAQTIAQNKNALAKVANTAVTIAQTAATGGLIAATRALFAVMLANPFTAIIALVGLLASAYTLLADDTDDAAAAEKKYQQQLEKTKEIREFQIQLLREQGATEEEISRVKRANAERDLAQARTQLLVLTQQGASQKQINEQLNIILESKKVLLLDNAAQERRNDEQEKKNSENKKKRDEEAKQRLEAQIALKKEQIIREQELARAELLRYSQGQEFGELDIAFDIENRIKNLQTQADKAVEVETMIQKARKLNVSLSKEDLQILESLGIVTEEYKTSVQSLSDSQISSLEQWERVMMAIVDNDPRDPKATEKRIELLQKEQALYEKFLGSDVYKKIQNEQTKLETNQKLVTQGFIRINQEVPKAFGQIVKAQIDISEGVAFSFDELMNATKEFDTLRKKYVQDYVAGNVTLSKSDKNYKTEVDELTKTGTAYFDQLVENQKQVISYEQSISSIRLEFEKLLKTQSDLVSSGKLITGFISENREEIAKQIEIPLDFIQNTGKQLEFVQNTLKNVPSVFYKNVEGLGELITDFETELSKAGIDITKAEYSEKLRLLEEYLKNRQTKELTANQKTISDIQKGIQAFQSVLNSLAQTTSQYYAFQLDLLAKNSKEIQKQIVGDSEEAVQLRLEQEQIYNEKKKQLEKQSAVTALRISLAQSIANVAESITRAFTAGPVIGQIAAGIIAGIGVAQTALIGSQLSQIQSLQRGGIIKGQGGLVVGPSHEYGGVKFQGGGIELEGGEAVINRQSAVRYGSLLSSVNQLGGGRPLVSNNFDDSRIVEAIAKQRSEPIRAYVVEQDITSKQGVTRRLEQLSQI
jgi:hypothetical protein